MKQMTHYAGMGACAIAMSVILASFIVLAAAIGAGKMIMGRILGS